jgi:hypothetical protein
MKMSVFDNQQWTWATIPNSQWRPARWKASTNVNDYTILFASREPKPAKYQGAPPTYETLRLRAPSLVELKKRVVQTFPKATFSNVTDEDVKQAHAREMREEKARQQRVQEQRDFEASVMREHTNIALGLSREEQAKHAGMALKSFMTNPQWGGTSWVKWFRKFPNDFFSYPNGENKNRDTICRYLQEHYGTIVGIAGWLADAMNYLLKHGHFYMQESYKRSEKHLRDAVVRYNGREAEPPAVSEDTVREAVKRLTSRFGMPLSVSIERLQAVGYKNAQQVFDAIQSRYNPGPVESASPAELKAGLAELRRRARGGVPIAGSTLRRGY